MPFDKNKLDIIMHLNKPMYDTLKVLVLENPIDLNLENKTVNWIYELQEMLDKLKEPEMQKSLNFLICEKCNNLLFELQDLRSLIRAYALTDIIMNNDFVELKASLFFMKSFILRNYDLFHAQRELNKLWLHDILQCERKITDLLMRSRGFKGAAESYEKEKARIAEGMKLYEREEENRRIMLEEKKKWEESKSFPIPAESKKLMDDFVKFVEAQKQWEESQKNIKPEIKKTPQELALESFRRIFAEESEKKNLNKK